MGWEHKIAKEFKKRDNPQTYAWFSGTVLSPKKIVMPDGSVYFQGPTIISCFDGQVMLKKDRLYKLEESEQVSLPQKVALLGNPFSHDPGSQKILVLGAIEDVV